MAYLSQIEMMQRGDRKGMITSDPNMLAFVWMDCQRRYFIATASSLVEGAPYK